MWDRAAVPFADPSKVSKPNLITLVRTWSASNQDDLRLKGYQSADKHSILDAEYDTWLKRWEEDSDLREAEKELARERLEKKKAKSSGGECDLCE